MNIEYYKYLNGSQSVLVLQNFLFPGGSITSITNTLAGKMSEISKCHRKIEKCITSLGGLKYTVKCQSVGRDRNNVTRYITGLKRYVCQRSDKLHTLPSLHLSQEIPTNV